MELHAAMLYPGGWRNVKRYAGNFVRAPLVASALFAAPRATSAWPVVLRVVSPDIFSFGDPLSRTSLLPMYLRRAA